MADHHVLAGLFDPATFDTLKWQPFRLGVEIYPIHGSGDATAAALLRYRKGAAVPRHFHPAHEHIVVLSGSQSDERGRYGAGTVVVNLPGTRHSVVSEEGCVVLAIWERPVVIEDGA